MLDMITAWLPLVLGMLATGLLAGLLAGLLGVGGGIVIVPVFYFILQAMGIDPDVAIRVATATSLMVIVPTSISSVRAHHGRGNVDWALIRRWWPFMVTGVVAGSTVSLYADGSLIGGVFGVIALLVAANILLRPRAKPVASGLPRLPGQGLMAGSIGFFSVMIGIGGGTMGVPMLTACNYPSHRAVGTAAFFGLLIALPGAIAMLLATTPEGAPAGMLGAVNLAGFLAIVPLTVFMAPVGARLGARLDALMLKRVFAVFLCISGVRMLMQALGG